MSQGFTYDAAGTAPRSHPRGAATTFCYDVAYAGTPDRGRAAN
jgi:hypothetical protein